MSCGRVTTQALLKRKDRGERDYGEDMQRVALGGDGGRWDADRLRRQYRHGNLPRNPNLCHWYVIADAQAAWVAGERSVTALCGEAMELHRNPKTIRSKETSP